MQDARQLEVKPHHKSLHGHLGHHRPTYRTITIVNFGLEHLLHINGGICYHWYEALPVALLITITLYPYHPIRKASRSNPVRQKISLKFGSFMEIRYICKKNYKWRKISNSVSQYQPIRTGILKRQSTAFWLKHTRTMRLSL